MPTTECMIAVNFAPSALFEPKLNRRRMTAQRSPRSATWLSMGTKGLSRKTHSPSRCLSSLRSGLALRDPSDRPASSASASANRRSTAVFRAACAASKAGVWRSSARAGSFGAVQGDQRVAVQAAHGREAAARVEVLDERVERVVEVCRRHAVEQLPDVVVARDVRQAEQRVRVGPRAALGQRALVRQERRRLHEEHRQRRHADVGHGVAPVAAAARVRHAREARPQPVEAAIYIVKLPSSRRSTVPPHRCGQNENCCPRTIPIRHHMLRRYTSVIRPET